MNIQARKIENSEEENRVNMGKSRSRNVEWPERVRLLILEVILLISVCSLTGCKTTELEDRCFPMLAAVEQSRTDGQIDVSYLYQPLDKVSDKATGQAGIDTFVVGANDFYKAWHNYENGLNKVVDYNHLKIILLGTQMLENTEQMSEMLEVLEKEENFPRNTYVCVTDKVSEMLKLQESLPSNLGTYLEELLENNEYVDANGLPTLGNLFEEKVNHLETLYLPFFSVEEELPVQEGFYCMRRGEPVKQVSTEAAYLSFLESKNLKQAVVELEDGSFLKLSAFQTDYDLSTQGRVTVRISCEGKMNFGAVDANDSISRYVSDYFTDIAGKELEQSGIDVSNCYKKIGGYNREWYMAWKEQLETGSNKGMLFESNLTIVYQVEVVMTSERVT